MTIQSIAATLATMVAGECRWVGNPGIHVYAMGSSRDDGRYDPKRTVFKVVCESRDYNAQAWLDLLTASAIVLEEAK